MIESIRAGRKKIKERRTMEEKKNIQPHNEVKDEELDAVTGGAGAITGFLPT